MLTRAQFLQKYYPEMIAVTKDTGLFPQVMAAQAIVESSGLVNGLYYPGESILAKQANNYFGIKTSSQWKGETITLKTGEYYNGKKVIESGTFRKYPTTKAGFEDYKNFLKSNPRYTAAGVFKATTPAAQAQALQAAGYATDPNYSKLLIGVMAGFDNIIKTIKNIPIIKGGTALIIAVALFFLIGYKNKK